MKMYLKLFLLIFWTISALGQGTAEQFRTRDDYKVKKDELVFMYGIKGFAPAWEGVTSSATRHTYEGAPPLEGNIIFGAESFPKEFKGLVLSPEMMSKVLDIEIIVPSNYETAGTRPKISEKPIDIIIGPEYGTSLRNVYKFKIDIPKEVGAYGKQYILKLKVKNLDLLGKKSLRMGSDNCLADTFVFDVRECKTPADKDALLYMQTMYKVETNAPDALDALKSIVEDKKYNDKKAILGLLQSIGDLCIKKGLIEEGIAWSLIALRYNQKEGNETAYHYFCSAIENSGGWEKVILMEPAINEKYRQIDKEFMEGFTPEVDWALKDLKLWEDKRKKEQDDRKAKRENILEKIKNHDESNYKDLIELAKDRSQSRDFKSAAYDQLIEILKNTKNQGVKNDLTDYLMNKCEAHGLPEFDFKVSTALPDDIRDKKIREYNNNPKLAIQYVYSSASDYENELKRIFNKSDDFKQKFNMGSEEFPFGEREYSLRLSLAKMGKKEQLDKSIEMGKYISKRDPTIVFTAWAYIRQPETIDILKPYLFEEDPKLNVEAMKHLSDCIIGFPYDPKDKAQNEDIPKTLETCRKWMKENYNPRKINSKSVLIDGKLYDNTAEKNDKKEIKNDVDEKPDGKDH